jgi:predicted ATP-binding protein involved in virulence
VTAVVGPRRRLYDERTVDRRNVEEDIFVDWLLHAYAGTREIHDVTPRRHIPADPLATRHLVAVNDSAQAARLLRREQLGFHLWIVPPAFWKQAQDGQAALPEGFGSQPVRSWHRTSRHEKTATRIEHLTLTNFRRFEQTRVAFRPDINVLIGQNGTGKTTILDALAMGLAGGTRLLHRNIGDAFSESALRLEDVRVARIEKGGIPTLERQMPARIDAEMWFCGEPMESGPQAEMFGDGGVATGPGRPIAFVDFVDLVRWAVQDGFDVTLPLVAYYGAGRTWRSGQKRASERDDLSRLAGYEGCLEPSTHLSDMRAWFRRMELLALQEGRIPPVLEASKRAILVCLEGCDLVRYDARLDDLAARFAETGLLLGFDQLSDGQRNMLGMVADMAYRASTLNPHLGAAAPEQTPGVVLIDEIDLHLHPSWQRRVVHDLRRAFPQVQFIVTTHSPQVLSEVPGDAVILLAESQPSAPAAPTEGRDTNSILWEVLGVTAHPRETVVELEAVAHLLDDGRHAEARARLDALARTLTERDPEIGRLRGLLDVVERIDASDQEGT